MRLFDQNDDRMKDREQNNLAEDAKQNTDMLRIAGEPI